LVTHAKERHIESVLEQGAEEDIWT